MRTRFSVYESPWHIGWEPLMDWLREQGADPNDVHGFELSMDAPEATFFELERNAEGRPFVRGGKPADRVVRRRISSFPPVHPEDARPPSEENTP